MVQDKWNHLQVILFPRRLAILRGNQIDKYLMDKVLVIGHLNEPCASLCHWDGQPVERHGMPLLDYPGCQR